MDDIKIIEIRIRNFRCLKSVNVKLDDLTVLTGQNNSGKTSFIDALNAGIGAGRQKFTEDDIYLAEGEKRLPKDRAIIVDLLIHPWNRAENKIAENFIQGSYWLQLWANGIQQDKNDNDFVGIGIEFKWDSMMGEYRTIRKFLKEWKEVKEELDQSRIKEIAASISPYMIEPLALYLLDEKRDIIDEFRKTGSFWYKLISDPGLKNEDINKFEKSLNELNSEIIKGSDVLTHLLDHLNDLFSIISYEKGQPFIFPIPRQLDDLSKGIDIGISSGNKQVLSLTRYGLGTRSLATIVLFNAFITLKQRRLKNGRMHPFLAIEEPENHIHPQAQRAIFNLIKKIQGQIIITSHSPYIIEQAKLQQIRHFQRIGSNSKISQMDVKDLSEEDLRKIRRMVLKTRGYMFYARALILMEGETEEQGLPTFAEQYWKQTPNKLGIEFIGVGGDGNYFPFLRLAQSFGIQWYIFSDGESNSIRNVNNALNKIHEPIIPQNPFVFVIPDGEKYETCLIKNEYQDELIEMIINLKAENEIHRQTLEKEWKSKKTPIDEIRNFADHNKTKCAIPLAEAILSSNSEELRFPVIIRSLLEKISEDLKISNTRAKSK